MTDAEKWTVFNDTASLVAKTLGIELEREALLDNSQGYWCFKINYNYEFTVRLYEFTVRLTDSRFTLDTEDSAFRVDFRQDEPTVEDRKAIAALNLITKAIFMLNAASKTKE